MLTITKNRKHKIRSIDQLNEGETYLISSPAHKDWLVKITNRQSQTVSVIRLNSEKITIFNWNSDFVMGEGEIYSVN